MTAVVDNEVSQPAFKSLSEKKPKQNWLSKFKKKFMNISSSDEQLEFDDTEYTEDYENNFVEQQFLPDKIKKERIWKVQENPAEKKMGDWLRMLWKGKY